ncbi:hypothetical protein LTR84_011883 [Exophiala bonariae]|uniref:BTB domain-containing protein n=1 Tax=Exophiala bonariae TaxID=1690606 RepID=A0AAV9NHN8_9EURO|nr:hypothetical protein LTR84_011883 [Exophiala bonariae]
MAIEYMGFVESAPVSFKIGPAKKKCYIHNALLEQHFKPLWDFRNNANREEQTEVLSNIEEETFVRFVEFAYTGSYSVPQPVPFLAMNGSESLKVSENREPSKDFELDSEEAGIVPPPEDVSLGDMVEEPPYEESPAAAIDSAVDQQWGTWGVKKKKKLRKQPPKFDPWQEPSTEPVLDDGPAAEDAPEEFDLQQFERDSGPYRENGAVKDRQNKKATLWKSFICEAKTRVLPPWEPAVSTDDNLDFAPVLLSHAKLYAFSNQFEIESLRQLALERLRLTLARFGLVVEHINAITQLLKYAYTVGDAIISASEGGHAELREMVIDYVICHVESLVQDQMFLDFLQEPGLLSRDLVLKLLLRLN